MLVAVLTNFLPSAVVLVPLGLIAISSVFFSRGILIFLTALCLPLTHNYFRMISLAATNLRWVFFTLFALHVFGDILLGRTVRKIKTFDVLAIVFIAYAFLSSLYSPSPILTLERATTVLVLYISVFWIIWKYAYDQGPEKIVSLILNVTLLIFIINYLWIFIVPHQAFLGGRFQGMLENPNSIGVTCAILLPLSLWESIEAKKMTPLFFLMLLGLILCASRNSIAATIISLGYFVYVRSKKYKPLIFFFSLSFILIIYWAVETLIRHLFHSYIRTETIPTMGGRIDVWPRVLDLIRNKPIFGYGFGVESKILALKYPIILGKFGSYAHNSYLGMMLQLGIFGAILFFAPLFILLWKELFLKQDGDVPLLRHALRTSLLAGLLCCIFESWIYGVGNAQAFPFWIIVMLLVFYRSQDKEKLIPEST